MIERRMLIGGAVATRLGALIAPGDAPQTSTANRDDDRTAAAIDDLRAALTSQFESTELGPSTYVSRIRQAQRMHLAATQRYPAFLEVGIDVWDRIYDWHVKHRQPLDARLLADGRYAMTFTFTTLVLRPDQSPDYVSVPYDVLPR